MLKLSKFAKEHFPLSAYTLGLAVLGYLGYHAIRWIINKCQNIQIIDAAAQENLKQRFFSRAKPLINRVSQIEISPDKITMGQGEYVVFHQLPSGEKRQLASETFEQVYKVLIQYSPLTLINGQSDEVSETCANRYELIQAKLKEIDPTLEAVFIPKTLYELIFIRKCIQEDLKHKKICPGLDPTFHQISLKTFKNDEAKYQVFLQEQKEERIERKCWHLCYFTDAGGNNEHPGVKEVAYRLNKAIVKLLNPSSESFSHQELAAFAEKEIAFLKAHHQKGCEIIEKQRKGESVEEISDSHTPGPTTNFGFESSRGNVKPMGLRHEADAQMIRDAIALDCSKIAQRSLFLYRGADFQKDFPFCQSNREIPYSLSYGSSLFAGCLYDGGATAFHYMRKEKNAYAISIPFERLHHSPFYVPPAHTVTQLFGDGEVFHVRTKAWKGFDVEKMAGMDMEMVNCTGHAREHLKSHLSKEELITQFQDYKNHAIQLK